MSTRADLKENILAARLEKVLLWAVANRASVFTMTGLIVVVLLIGSVFWIRNREKQDLNLTLLGRAEIMIQQRQYAQADRILDDLRGAFSDPSLAAQVYYYQGLSAFESRDFDKAVASFKYVSEKSGNSPLRALALDLLGSTYEQKKDYLSAAQTYEKFMTDYSEHFLAPRVQLAIGRSYLLAGKIEESKKALNQLIDLYPTSSWAQNARQMMDKIKTR